jgi:hypothetical protein
MNLIQHIRNSSLAIGTLLMLCSSMLFLNSCDDDNGTPAEKPTPAVTTLSPASGAPGTTITLTGTNFSTTPADVAVKFGAQTATVATSTATQITATVPAGIAPGTVAVTVTIGGKTSAGVNFTVTAPPPTIASIQPLSGSKGTTVTITGANFSANASTVKFGTVTAIITTATATQLVTKVPDGINPGAYPITITVGTETVTGTQNFTVTPVKAIGLYWIGSHEGQFELVKGTPDASGDFSTDAIYPATTDASLTGLARDSESNAIYWGEQAINWETFEIESSIWKGDTLGGEASVVVGPADGLKEIGSIAIDAAHDKLYWADGITLWRSNTDGSDIEQLFEAATYETIGTLALNATHLYFVELQSDGSTVVYKGQLDGSGIPVALLDDSDVPAAGGSTNKFVGIVASNEMLYLASQPAQASDKSEILKADLTLTAPTLEIVYQSTTDESNPLNFILGVTRDPKTGYLYWINRGAETGASSIYRGDATGSGAEVLLTELTLPELGVNPVNGRKRKISVAPTFFLAF